MFLPGTRLSRREALRGLGVTVALPLLDAMVPAGVHATTRARTRYGSPMGDPNQHNHKRVPFFIAGRGANAARDARRVTEPK